MESLHVAYLGPDTSFSENLQKELNRHLKEKTLEWGTYEIKKKNIGSFFKKHKKRPFDWVFFDFETDPEYKVDLAKIMNKYQQFQEVTTVAIIDRKSNFLRETDLLGLNFKVLAAKKKSVKDIIEDIEILSGKNPYNENHFKTIGYNQFFWLQIPCRANFKEGKIKLYSPVDDFSPIKKFKEELKKNEKELDPKIKKWMELPEDSFELHVYNKDKDKDSSFLGTDLRTTESSLKVTLPEVEAIRFGNAIAANRQSDDHRKRVLIFDSRMEFFEKCWGTNHSEHKVNMFNFPYLTSDFRIVKALAPELILVRGGEEKKGGISREKIIQLLENVEKMEEGQPLVAVFNSPSNLSSNYPKLLKMPFDMTNDYIDKLLDLLIKGQSADLGENHIELQNEIHEWRTGRLKNLVFLEVPVMIQEISENHFKIKCPFKLKSPTLFFENGKFGVFMALTPNFDSIERESIYSGIFIGEDEPQKTEIRRFVNEIHFTPKSEEQIRELEEFKKLNKEKGEILKKSQVSEKSKK